MVVLDVCAVFICCEWKIPLIVLSPTVLWRHYVCFSEYGNLYPRLQLEHRLLNLSVTSQVNANRKGVGKMILCKISVALVTLLNKTCKVKNMHDIIILCLLSNKT